MSSMRLYLSRRGRLPLLVTFMVLLAMVVVAPSVGARAAVKQFTAGIVGGSSGSLTETVKNCGTPLAAPCTAASTIAIGSIEILVPSAYQPVSSWTISSPNGRVWTASYDSTAGAIEATASGSDKLGSGESVNITFTTAAPTTSLCGTFTTNAWGSPTNHTAGGDPFQVVGTQPTVCALTAGGKVTDPTGTQTETVGGNFTGSLNVTFGGNLTCSNTQWSQYHLPIQVTITLGADFQEGTPPEPKFSTSEFSAPAGNDSSWYLICYASDPSAAGTILQPCYPGAGAPLNNPPCVDKQYRDLTTQKIVITIKLPPGDPLKH